MLNSDWDTGLRRLHQLLTTPDAVTILLHLHHGQGLPHITTASDIDPTGDSEAVLLLRRLGLVQPSAQHAVLRLTCRGRRVIELLPDEPAL